MNLHAHTDHPRKKIRKLAERFSDQEVRASLDESDDWRPFIFEDPCGSPSVMFWSAYDGPMMMMDDDKVRVYAQIEFLRRHAYPVFRSDAEIRAYAATHGWPRKTREDLNKDENGA